MDNFGIDPDKWRAQRREYLDRKGLLGGLLARLRMAIALPTVRMAIRSLRAPPATQSDPGLAAALASLEEELYAHKLQDNAISKRLLFIEGELRRISASLADRGEEAGRATTGVD